MKLLQTNDKKLLNQQKINVSQKMMNQRGAALIIFMLVLILSAATYFVGGLSSNTVALDREKQTQAALAEAKAALIGDAVEKQGSTLSSSTPAVTLSNPDLGSGANEGDEAANAGAIDHSAIGRFPWRSLGTVALKDGSGECLWYVVSGRFKTYTHTTMPLNWDTQGQIDVIDEKDNQLATNLAALVIAPGSVLSGQDRSSGQVVYPQCGGNYDAKNYLDTFDLNNAILGNVNYFPGTANNSKAQNSNNTTFVMTNNASYNDRFIFVTADDIFNQVMFRAAFSNEIDTLLANFQNMTISISTGKGTGNFTCANTDLFCENWIEMVFVKNYGVGNKVPVTWFDPKTMGTVGTANCQRVIIFGGQKTKTQMRDASAKNNPVNYLEAPNYVAFTASSSSGLSYQGVSKFDPHFPTLDVIQCVP
ncbi:MAG TPA: hypothetical protein VGJ90_12130 [Methylophilaceae bacterium]|jgi:hypothetical protein